MRSILIIALLLCCPLDALFAHNPDQEDHLLNLRIGEGGVLLLDCWISHGDLLGRIRRNVMDTNSDGILDDAEIRAFSIRQAVAFREGLQLFVDGEPAKLEIADQNVTMGHREVMPKGFWMSFTYAAQLSWEPGRQTRVHIRDANNLSVVGLIDIQLEQGKFYCESFDEEQEQGLLQGAHFTLMPGSGEAGDGYAAVLRTPIPENDMENVARTMFEFMRSEGVTEEQALELFRDKGAQNTTQTLESYLEGGYTFGMILTGLCLAFLFGAVHALTPGHGKTIVAAYLVGTRGRVRDAVFLGGVVTFTHVASVILLSLLVLFASEYILPQELFPWLTVSSGLLIVIIGLILLRQRVRQKQIMGHTHSHGGHSHSHGHTHQHEHASDGVSMKSLLGLGITGGIVPCPEALVVLLFAIDIHRYIYGLLMIGVFSLGLAAVLILIGVLMVTGSPLIKRFTAQKEASVFRVLSVGSAAVIMLIGIGIMIMGLQDARLLVINL
jgi:nickel/cobalt transporter (NicO) family protein